MPTRLLRRVRLCDARTFRLAPALVAFLALSVFVPAATAGTLDQSQPNIRANVEAAAFFPICDPNQALQWLEQAYRDHSFWLAAWAKVDPRMDVLRGDARFQDLLRRLGLGSA